MLFASTACFERTLTLRHVLRGRAKFLRAGESRFSSDEAESSAGYETDASNTNSYRLCFFSHSRMPGWGGGCRNELEERGPSGTHEETLTLSRGTGPFQKKDCFGSLPPPLLSFFPLRSCWPHLVLRPFRLGGGFTVPSIAPLNNLPLTFYWKPVG